MIKTTVYYEIDKGPLSLMALLLTCTVCDNIEREVNRFVCALCLKSEVLPS